MKRLLLLPLLLVPLAFAEAPAPKPALPLRQMEALGRGVVAIQHAEGKVFVSWRLLGTDPDDIAFNLYRQSGDAEAVKLNAEPLKKATCFADATADLSKPTAYTVRPVVDGKELTTAQYTLVGGVVRITPGGRAGN